LCKYFQLASFHELFQIWHGGTKYRKLTHGYIAWSHRQENHQLVWSCASTDCFQVSVGKKLTMNCVLVKKGFSCDCIENCKLHYIPKVYSFNFLKIRWIEPAYNLLNVLSLSVTRVYLFFARNSGSQRSERMTCLSFCLHNTVADN
jgi:hypothetical protein